MVSWCLTHHNPLNWKKEKWKNILEGVVGICSSHSRCSIRVPFSCSITTSNHVIILQDLSVWGVSTKKYEHPDPWWPDCTSLQVSWPVKDSEQKLNRIWSRDDYHLGCWNVADWKKESHWLTYCRRFDC